MESVGMTSPSGPAWETRQGQSQPHAVFQLTLFSPPGGK
jgi:hypothetical protein